MKPLMFPYLTRQVCHNSQVHFRHRDRQPTRHPRNLGFRRRWESSRPRSRVRCRQAAVSCWHLMSPRLRSCSPRPISLSVQEARTFWAEVGVT